MLIAPLATIAVLAQVSADAETTRPCPPGPMPAAIESAGNPPVASDVIEFAATPSLQIPGRAWVIRVYRRGSVDAGIEIVRLQRPADCNRYDIGARWRAPLQQAEYHAIAEKVAPVGAPTASTFIPPSAGQQLQELVTDGTGLELRLRSGGWRAFRSLNHYSRSGSAVSAIFREIASKYVPAAKLPEEDWRTK